MDDDLHRVVGVYATRAEAEVTHDLLMKTGVAASQLKILQASPSGAVRADGVDSDEVLNDILRRGAIGTAVGTAAGAAGTVAIALANVSLFVASPVLGTLAMLGWGAGLGGLVGAVAGADQSKGDMAQLIRQALDHGHVVLVADALSSLQTEKVHQIVGTSVAGTDSTASPARPTTTPTTTTVPG